MPLLYQHRIYRQDLKNNPDVMYVFGDNTLRVGLGGQAKEMRGEPNAIGVATKFKPTMEEDAFFSDEKFTEVQSIIAKDLLPIMTALKLGKIVIWPSDGIGSGLSEIPTRAPRLWDFMERCRKHLETL